MRVDGMMDGPQRNDRNLERPRDFYHCMRRHMRKQHRIRFTSPQLKKVSPAHMLIERVSSGNPCHVHSLKSQTAADGHKFAADDDAGDVDGDADDEAKAAKARFSTMHKLTPTFMPPPVTPRQRDGGQSHRSFGGEGGGRTGQRPQSQFGLTAHCFR